MKKLFTRDNIVWSLSFIFSIILFAIGHTTIPQRLGLSPETVKDTATLIGFISGKLGWSSLPSSMENKNE